MREGSGRLRETSAAHNIMIALWIAILVAGPALGGLLLYKVINFEDRPTDRFMRPEQKREVLTPRRGDILDCKGRILATTMKTYKVYLDCVQPSQELWDKYIGGLSEALSKHFSDRSAASYRKMLESARKKNRRHFLLKSDLSQGDVNVLRKMPLLKLGQFKGGYMEECREIRLYPYGSCAAATLGCVVTNKGKCLDKRGIEGSWDDVLHGTDGSQMYRKGEFGMQPVSDPLNCPAVDGKDMRLTIDIDVQAIADTALRRMVEHNDMIEKACVVVMESSTGAVRAMVNLGRQKDRKGLGEWANYALRTAEAPGSVFKGAVLMAMLEEGYIKSLNYRIPTYGGKWKYNGQEYNDVKHVGPKVCPSGYITVREAFEKSANNPFRQLICDERTFGSNPARFVDKVKGFGLFDTLGFDIKGATAPFILSPDMKQKSWKGFWDGGTFPRMAIGYGMEIPPINIVTFYNAIACGGTVMKPYLVESLYGGSGDDVQFHPTVLRKDICRKSTADTLKRVMSMVAEDKNGTAYFQLHGTICRIAGKTGTAQRVFKSSVTGRYVMHDNITGEESHQGSFVGFFPVDKPKYTAIVVVWSKVSKKNFYGATYAAPVFREIAEKIHCLNAD